MREYRILGPPPSCSLGNKADGSATDSIGNAVGEVGRGMDGRGRG